MQGMTVRRAGLRDLDTILEFQRAIVEAERPFDPTMAGGSIRYYDIAALLVSDQVLFAVAELDDRPVGCGFVRLEAAKPYLEHRVHGYLGLMYVDPAVRGCSVNGRIIEFLKQWCRSRGVRELRLEVYYGNAPARRAYEKAGFTPHILEMRCAL